MSLEDGKRALAILVYRGRKLMHPDDLPVEPEPTTEAEEPAPPTKRRTTPPRPLIRPVQRQFREPRRDATARLDLVSVDHVPKFLPPKERRLDGEPAWCPWCNSHLQTLADRSRGICYPCARVQEINTTRRAP